MPSGSCFCGKVKIDFTGEAQAKALCHCNDCRKISGSTHSANIIVPEEGFNVTGSPKSIAKTADSGNTITSYFCGDCGSTLFRAGATFPGSRIVKIGVLDGTSALNDAKPMVELFAPERVSWVPQVAGTTDKPGMP